MDEIARFAAFSGGVSSPTTGVFLGLDDGDPVEDKALEAHILIEATAVWQGIAFQIREAFIMRLAFIGGTQEAHVTGLIDHEEVFDRMALLLAAVVVLLVLGIGWAVDRSLRTIMPKRGDPRDILGPFSRRATPLNRQRCELEANLDVLRPDSTRHGGGESTVFAFDCDIPKSCPCTS